MAYVSFGMFASSLTENQVISAIISVGFFLLLWFLPNMVSAFSNYIIIYYNVYFIYNYGNSKKKISEIGGI